MIFTTVHLAFWAHAIHAHVKMLIHAHYKVIEALNVTVDQDTMASTVPKQVIFTIIQSFLLKIHKFL